MATKGESSSTGHSDTVPAHSQSNIHSDPAHSESGSKSGHSDPAQLKSAHSDSAHSESGHSDPADSKSGHSDPAHSKSGHSDPAKKKVPEKKHAHSYIICGSLISFDENMSKEVVDNLIDVSLFCQLAASASLDRSKEPEKWYKKYSEYLNLLGWNFQSFTFDLYKSHVKVFEIATAVTDRAKELGGEGRTIAAKIEKTFESLKKADKKTLEFFHSHSIEENEGNFQVAVCSEDELGDITMAMVCAYFTTKEKVKDLLFGKLENIKIKLYLCASTVAFNSQQFERVRKEVEKKLGDAEKKDVHEICPCSHQQK